MFGMIAWNFIIRFSSCETGILNRLVMIMMMAVNVV